MALRTYLTGIADAIREKKGTTDPINAQDFASEIASISTGGGGTGDNLLQALITGKGVNGGAYLCAYYQGTNVDFLNGIDLSATTSMSYMFAYCSNITTIPQLDTSKVTNMNNMFAGCFKLTTIPQLDTSSVTDMDSMFNNCEKLTTVLLSDTSNVTDMGSMFNGCKELLTIPQLNTSSVTASMAYMFAYCYKLTTIPQLDTSKTTGMNSMFAYCYKLTTIPQLDTSKVTNMKYMFENCKELQKIDITKLANSSISFASSCYSLTKVIIRTMDTIPTYGSSMFGNCYHMSGTVDSTYNPNGLQDGRIYVPDDKVDALKAVTGWANFADVIVPLSTLVED